MKKQKSFMISLMIIISLLCVSFAYAAETVIYSEGFEADNGGYVVSGNAEWEWGTPSGTVGPGAAHAGMKCWGTDLDGTLNRPSEGSIVSPAIMLPPVDANQIIRVRFWGYVNVDGMYDRGEFFVSKDGTNWESLIELFNKMETASATPAGWHKYEFGISNSYANGPIYLRFRAATRNTSPSFYCGTTSDLSGLYVDDVAITVSDVTGARKIFTMEAWEDPSAWASCPWVLPWNGTEYQADNDIYSVARGAENEYADSYKLMVPLAARDGVYPVVIQEREQEDSYTDFAALVQIDHELGIAVAPDGAGVLHSYVPSALMAPVSAVSGAGTDVATLVSVSDDNGYAAFHDGTVIADFGTTDITGGATLVLRAAGFIIGESQPVPYTGQPAVIVETLNSSGQWQERGRLKPRFAYSVAAFDLSPFFANGDSVKVRLRSVSHDVKYNSIDSVALYTGRAPQFTAIQVLPTSARFGGQDVLGEFASADGNYFKLSPGEQVDLEFPVLPLAENNVREFIFLSKGYYVPKSGTYLIYTWDGNNWVLRDGYSYPGSDFTKDFDLSLFLPDPAGEYKVRIWQDYQYEPAGIDYVKMTADGVVAPLEYAWDLKNGSNILNTLLLSDNVKTSWASCPRNRVVEVRFTPPVINVPPTTNPVAVTDLIGPTPTISWTYADADGDTQAEAEVEVWTGPGATGIIMWDPAVLMGTGTTVVYAGLPLQSEVTYYARVRANDGKDWGQWSETSFSVILNRTPNARCSDVTVSAGSVCMANASIDNGSSDPDGDPVTIVQTPAGPYSVGVTSVTLTITDDKGASASCTATVTVIDTTLPTITCPANVTVNADLGQCSAANVSLGAPQTGDNCSGSGVTNNAPASFAVGATVVTWTVTDASGNTASCAQTVVVENPAPVVTLTGPANGSIYAINNPVNFTATFTDAGGGTHTGIWMFDTTISTPATIVEPSGSNPGSATATYAFTMTGVYKVKLTVIDSCGASGMANQIDGMDMMIVVYDPNDGFVTGGGWIDSKPGAYLPDPNLTGKANFGFVSKYKKGATVPTGETEFQFHVASLNFHSGTYQWLVISGAKAQYKGSGQINGQGNYGFLLTATDGQINGGGGVDKFRIKIWNIDSGALVYDNVQGADDDIANANPQAISGGSIVIHK